MTPLRKTTLKFNPATAFHVTVGIAADDGNLIPLSAALLETIPSDVFPQPKYLHVVHSGGAAGIALASIAFGDSNVAIIAGEGIGIPAHQSMIFDVVGYTHFAVIGDVADTEMVLTALENY